MPTYPVKHKETGETNSLHDYERIRSVEKR